ncbi:hypothetical protein [Photorhabdus hainanensis]|uniref:hypothetical protein n=1 Tax=Photorhabdus hainanensis TaxID=1004166 RepID=UPI001BD383E8|nr:hypothetical protein [Photorhabdus hainanensis]MBS9434543.1 hypothetical protein [Photorhabdus hainanensis]
MAKALIYIFLLSFYMVSLQANATSEIEQKAKENSPYAFLNATKWEYSHVSSPIRYSTMELDHNFYNKIFAGKNIQFENDMVSISGKCSYQYAIQKKSPLEYWHSEKIVSIYKKLFSDNDVKIPGFLYVISPVFSTEKCEYPFSDFIVLDRAIIFVYKQRAIFYFEEKDKRLHHIAENTKCKSSKKDLGFVFEHGAIDECFYEKETLVDVYNKYINKSDVGKYLTKSLEVMKNTHVFHQEDDVDVQYFWENKKKLKIILNFMGGMTEVSFKEDSDGTKVVTKYYPD